MNLETLLTNSFVEHWLKAGLILALTWMIVRTALRRRSASARHAVWLVGIAAALILPIASAVLPDWRVLPSAERSGIRQNFVERSSHARPGEILTNSATAANPDKARIERQLPGWQTILFAIWLVGAALIFFRIPAAWARLAAATRRSKSFETSLTDVETRISPEVSVPLVWGWVRPTILLPDEARNWPESRLRSALLHETAHVRRRDPLIQVFLEIARAALWLQPLVWVAIRKLRAERESACDDAVLAEGVCPKSYATDLLDIVSRQPAGVLAMAMASPSTLENRVRGVLDSTRSRGRTGSCWWLASLVFAMAITAPLAMLSAQAQEPKAEATQENPRKDPPKAEKPWTARGIVKDEAGKPMAGVEIRAFCGMGTLRRTGVAQTGEDGRYELNFGPVWRSDDGISMQAATIYASKPGFYEVDLCRAGDCVAALKMPDGFPDENNPWGAKREKLFVPGEAKELNFTLAPAKSLSGRLQDENGPVAGRKISLSGPDLPPSTSVLATATTDEDGNFQLDEIPTKFGYSLLIPEAENRRSGWSLGPMFFKANDAPVAFALAENDAPMLAEELVIELAGDSRDDYEEKASTRAVHAEGGATLRLQGGGGRVRIGGGEGLRIQGNGAMRSKRLKISLGGAGGGGINLAP